jgi:hypothetical protein
MFFVLIYFGTFGANVVNMTYTNKYATLARICLELGNKLFTLTWRLGEKYTSSLEYLKN